MIPAFEQIMQLTRTISGEPALTDADARALYDCLAQVPKDGLVVETGCQLGRSSSLIVQMARAMRFHSVHIDPYCTEPPGVASPSVEYMQSWVALMRTIGGEYDHAFTFLCMRTEQAAWHLSKFGEIDVAFVDGDHELPGVQIDMQLIAERVKSGGSLTCHDYGNPGLLGVQQGVDAYITEDKWVSHGVSGSLAVWRRK